MTCDGLRVLALAALASLAGCDPGFDFDGTVVDAAGRPVENVQVVLSCYDHDQASTVTDSEGRFRGQRLGIFGDECAIVVRRGDGKALSHTLMRNCVRLYGIEKCHHVRLNVKLPADWDVAPPRPRPAPRQTR